MERYERASIILLVLITLIITYMDYKNNRLRKGIILERILFLSIIIIIGYKISMKGYIIGGIYYIMIIIILIMLLMSKLFRNKDIRR